MYIGLLLLGLTLGSFVNASVWRFHKKQSGKKIKDSHKYSIVSGRSMCTHCSKQLVARDLVPVVSWVLLRGKCRYCHKKIEDNPLAELLTATLFVLSYHFWPFALTSMIDIGIFILWLIVVVLLVFLFIYDIRWMLLPDKVVLYFTFAAALLLIAISLAYQDFNYLMGGVFAGLVAAGLFYVLFVVSKGEWIGGGDVKLLFGLGLLAGSVINVFLVVFLASLLGTIFALPKMLTGKLGLMQRLPFGPLLILSVIFVFLFVSHVDVYASIDSLFMTPLF